MHLTITDLTDNVFPTRYLWIKHNEQYDIKEGPITNFMPKIETNIDAAFWVPRRSTAYIIHGNSLVSNLQHFLDLIAPLYTIKPIINHLTILTFIEQKFDLSSESMFWTVKGSRVKGKPRALTHFGFPAWVQDVDAAVHIVKTGRTLFFMHDIYWR